MPLYAMDGKRPQVAAGAWIAPSAELIGEVIVEAGASVWFGAVIRADNTAIRIGRDSNVQEGAVLHSDPGMPLTIGAGCTVGHRAVLHGCTIGERVLVGIGAILLNGASIGDESLVGAGALVTEGKAFEPRQLILGSPAKAVRTLDEAAVAALRRSAEGYAAKQAHYAAALERIG